MIRSMTAFARQSGEYPWGNLVWELRSVNHRYLEPHFKLPDTLRALEPALRNALRGALARGKVECALRLQTVPAAEQGLTLNEGLLEQLVQAGERVRATLPQAAPIDPLALLQWPGVVQQPEQDADAIHSAALALFDQALAQLLASREREGAQLEQFIAQRLEGIEEIGGAVRQQLPAIMAAQRERLQQRLGDLDTEVDPQRLEQEVVILLQKADVDEELDRLQAHLAEVRRTLKKGGPCGRRLDFLMQELNREANTLSSKSVVSDTTQAAVELKVLIEQMREQIQNIE